jgi:hypothetical protein
VTPFVIVWNGTERRLRAPIRIALTAVLVFLLAAGFGIVLSVVAPPSTVPPAGIVVTSTLTAVAVGLACLVAAYALDRRPVRDYGLSIDVDWAVDLVAGVVLGLLLMTGIFLVSFAAGWATVDGTLRVTGGLSFPAAFFLVTLAFVSVSVGEELALRGYLLTNLAEGLRGVGERPALALATLGSATVFGATHAANPNATAVSVAGIALAGVMLGLGYVLTGRLALPIGLHFSWNLAQGPLFGFPVSGIDLGVSALVLDVRGPTYLTGGAFGPEAGLLGVAATVAGTALILGYTRVRGRADRSAVVVPDLRWWPWAERDSVPDPRLVGVDDAPGSDTSPYEE